MDKVQHHRGHKRKQASQVLKPAPPKLAELIDLVNLVPPDCELPHPDEAETNDWCIDPTHDECTASALQSFKRFLKGVPAKLGRYIWQIDPCQENRAPTKRYIDPPLAVILRLTAEQALDINELIDLGTDPVTAYEKLVGVKASKYATFYLTGEPKNDSIPIQYLIFERYSDFWVTRQSLYLIAALSNAAPDQRERIKKLYGWKGITLPRGFSNIYIDGQGYFRVNKDPVIDALEGVEATRIRTCINCDRIFWAGRIDQKCCSKKCAHVQRTRRWRERYLNSYKLQRTGYEPIDKDKTVALKKKKGR